MRRPLILVTGSRGQLGGEISLISKSFEQFDFLYLDKEEADLTDETSFLNFVNGQTINYVINCAAYTAVDLAETDQENAERVNALVPAILASYCKRTKARLLHISTDYVFDGNGNSPINESEKPNPLSVYGKTKLLGEERILQELDNAYIIRTAWVYSVYGNNFVKTMLRVAQTRPELSVVYDQVGTPTCARDLAKSLLVIIDCIEKGIDKPGIYHYSNEGAVSWYDFAKAIFAIAQVKCNVKPIRSSEYKTVAVRPMFSVLDKAKIKSVFSLDIPYWKDSLVSIISELRQ